MGKDETPQEGFTFWATVPGGGGTYRNAPWIKNGQAMRDSGYKTDAQGDFALEFLNQQKDRSKPFVLYMPFFAPHTPYDFQPERDRDAYAGSKFGCFPRLRPHSRQNPGLLRHFDDEESMRSYSALVTGMDRNVGRVLDQLEKMGAREDTVVVFSADQGYNCGHHGVWGKGNGTVPFNMYEESVRVPLIWSFPGRIAANRRSDAFVAHYDFFPTLLEYLGIEFRQSPAMPGSSYARLLRNQEFRARDRVYFEYCGVRGLRTADVKSVVREKGQFSEFYDIRKDPGETLNLWDSAAHARAREGAERQIGEFFRRVGAPPIDDWRKTTTQNLNVYRAPGL
jgi:arylsulfatase A-like enzyme